MKTPRSKVAPPVQADGPHSDQAAESRLITEFLQAMSADRGLSANSLAAYERDLTAALEGLCDAGRKFVTCDPDDIRRLLEIWHADGLAPRSVARRLSALRQMMGWVVEEGLRVDNPCRWISNPKQAPGLPKSLSEQEIAALIDAASSPDDDHDSRRMSAMLELLYATGLRVSELVSLRVDQFRRDPDAIFVVGKGGRERLVALGSPARVAIARWLEIRDQQAQYLASVHLFPADEDTHLTRHQFASALKKLALEAGIDAKRVSPHVIRHSFATHMLNRGADLRGLQTLLGHADISTTQIYTATRPDRLAGLVASAHPLAPRNQGD